MLVYKMSEDAEKCPSKFPRAQGDVLNANVANGVRPTVRLKRLNSSKKNRKKNQQILSLKKLEPDLRSWISG